MHKESWLSKFYENQAKLAAVIGGGVVTRKARLKAHRIWHGIRKPNETELALLHADSNGQITANNFYLSIKKPNKRKK